MSKPKVYEKHDRLFEVNVYDEYKGILIEVEIDEIIHPNRKFFGRTRPFHSCNRKLYRYNSIEEAVQSAFNEGFALEAQRKSINYKWEEWNK